MKEKRFTINKKKTSVKKSTVLRKTNANADTQNDCTVFVGNVSLNTTRRRLHAIFSEFGAVVTVRLRSVPCNNEVPKTHTSAEEEAPPCRFLPRRASVIQRRFATGRSTMNAYVQMASVEEASRAVTGVNGRLVDGFHWRVNLAASSATAVDAKCSVFVGGLPLQIEDEQLREHFASCGAISSIRVIRDSRSTGMPTRGFGYVNFCDAVAARSALSLDGSELLHRRIRVQPHSGNRSSSNVKSAKRDKPRHKSLTGVTPVSDGGQSHQESLGHDFGKQSGKTAAQYAGELVADQLLSVRTKKSSSGARKMTVATSSKKVKKPRWDNAARENRKMCRSLAATLPASSVVVQPNAAPVTGGSTGLSSTTNKKIVFSYVDDSAKSSQENKENATPASTRLEKLHQIRRMRKDKLKKRKKSQANSKLDKCKKRGERLAALLPKST